MTLPPTPEIGFIRKLSRTGDLPIGSVMMFPLDKEPPPGWQWIDRATLAAEAEYAPSLPSPVFHKDEELDRLERLVAAAIRDAIIACAPNSPGHFDVNDLELYESDGNLTIDCLEIARKAMRVHLDNMTWRTGGSRFEERG